MILAFLFVLVGLLALLLIIFSARGQFTTGGDLDELASQLRPVDIDAFRNLIATSEQQYLREHLPPAEFRALHRQRMLAATEYIRCAAQNAAILIRLGEAARHNPDPAVTAAAEKLLENAFHLRLYAFQVVPRLYVAMIFPQISSSPYALADTYDTMARQVVLLGCLQYPTHGMSSAL